MTLSEKYDSETWEEPCEACGKPVVVCNARLETMVFAMHDGCAGYPFCACAVKHQGECR